MLVNRNHVYLDVNAGMTQSLPEDRNQPFHAPVFEELHQALESLRRKSDDKQALAPSRLARARRLCQAGQFGFALRELQTLTFELASHQGCPSPSSSQDQWLSEEVVVA